MTDEFLVPGASYDRLIEEYYKYASLVIGFDFDNTVYDYHKTGASYNQVIQLLQDLKSINCKLICWTAQESHEFVTKYLTEHNIPCDGINDNAIPLKWETRKLHFSALLDDRAGLIQVYDDLTYLVSIVKLSYNKQPIQKRNNT